MTDGSPEPRLTIRGLSKAFGATRALVDVDLVVVSGSIHGLLGQNGSGKSTLIKVLSGYHLPDGDAEIALNGRPLSDGAGHGNTSLSFVHQDLGLVDTLSVTENLAVGRYRTRFGRVDWAAERAASTRLLDRFDVRCAPDAVVGRLSEVQRALIAIVRAVDRIERAGAPGLLVLDEPTVYLPKDGVDRLFATMRSVASSGTGVLFVSHQLAEVLTITDHVTVLRGGRVVASAPTAEVDEARLVEWIVGRPMSEVYAEHPAPSSDRPAITARELTGTHAGPIDITLNRGEIVGTTGLVGSGFEEVPYLLYGASRAVAGEVDLGDRTWPAAKMSPGRSVRHRIVLVPGNRGRQSVAPGLTVGENLEGPVLTQHRRGPFVRRRSLRAHLADLLRRYAVRPPDPDRRLGTLSGGNQQKAVVAKWLQVDPQVLLLHEPTQGVDVEARAEVFRVVAEAAGRGAAVLLASSELEDVARVCDRVLVFGQGRVVAQLSGPQLDAEALALASYRVEPAGRP